MACIGKRGWSERKKVKRERVEERWREDVEREEGGKEEMYTWVRRRGRIRRRVRSQGGRKMILGGGAPFKLKILPPPPPFFLPSHLRLQFQGEVTNYR